jgi:ATP-dependent helicase Lhr and Lhr-like helicase
MTQKAHHLSDQDFSCFHPLIARWFKENLGAPTPPQKLGWPAIASGRDTLIAAPTGSGKTLAAFLSTLDGLVRKALEGDLEDAVHTVYISPLKALGNDIQKNLARPLEGLTLLDPRCAAIRAAVRSGDTPAGERARMTRKPPHILITTPESLYILLTSEKGRAMLSKARMVIVDEIHAVAADKRGSHLALSLERLDRVAGKRLQRIGLSATQKPIQTIAGMLVGSDRLDPQGRPDCAIVDVGHRREMDLSIWIPDRRWGPSPPMSNGMRSMRRSPARRACTAPHWFS